jgi:hypothetical protein
MRQSPCASGLTIGPTNDAMLWSILIDSLHALPPFIPINQPDGHVIAGGILLLYIPTEIRRWWDSDPPPTD